MRLSFAAGVVFAYFAVAANADLKIANMANGETVRYPVVLLQGSAEGGRMVTARVKGRQVRVPVVDGKFKVLVQLEPGANTVHLVSEAGRRDIALRYNPCTSPYRVNVVFVVASDEKPRYDVRSASDQQNYQDRFDTAVKLMQTFTAESMNAAGFGRKTFNLEFDREGRVVIHTVKFTETGAELRKRDGGRLYNDLYGWIDRQFPMRTNKNLVLMGFSRFNPATGRAEAYTALGGGGMGLFGNAAMWSWPSSLQDVYRAFSDASGVDGAKIDDDSAGRSVAWALASTTIGAMLHEMGHAFGLPHTGDPTSIMQRGFDRFNRMFTVVEPPSKGQGEVRFGDDVFARWEPRSAAQLACSRWFQPDERSFDDTAPTVDVESGQVVVKARNGIGAVVFLPSNKEVAGDDVNKAFWMDAVKSRLREKRYTLKEIAEHAGKLKRFRMVVVDGDGNQIESMDTGALP